MQIPRQVWHGEIIMAKSMQRRSLGLLQMTSLHSPAQMVEGILEAVKDAEDVHAGSHSLPHRGFHHIVCVAGVAERVHPPQQHLHTSFVWSH